MKGLALGVVAALTLFIAVPAMAQVGFYAGPGGFGVQFGEPGYYGYPYWYGYYDYDYYGAPGFGWYGRYHSPWRHHHHWR